MRWAGCCRVAQDRQDPHPRGDRAARSAAVPEVPTFGELGFKSLGSSSWVGLFAPPGTPQAFIDRINAGVHRGGRAAATTANLATAGFDTAPSNPQQLHDAVRSELALWQPIIRESGFQID
jgi:tripartite-type tricarboxylate transporter receptor subunit TctC